ncbi:Na+/H+ antiporter subunit E [Nitrincola tapanii]|uniref:Na+/H+ antiporter subunit E n=1 Tax=Nitrincola tapanii TaxID=1708751 RepID=A0A5A9W0C3_9GAMM|nr:Na+/H+ antiporter subunit E [Nitrincola tapanii]KAA0873944.1 Na+/H+ antiporter subunit E [Nitrincola tapanii]
MLAKPRFRFLPMPYHSILLFVTWLLLNNTLAPGHLVLGAFLALGIPLLTSGLSKPQPALHKPFKTMRYAMMVLGDIVTANIEVAIQVVGPLKNLNPAFVAVPLDIEGELPITLLASTVSLTPGTVSAEVSACHKVLYVHALTHTSEDEIIRKIKERYEAPLMEIFSC